MSQILLFWDTETNGMPVWKIPSDRKEQPHMVQVAAILCDEDSKEVIETMDVIVKPDDWEIPDDMVDIHGITTEHALEFGISEIEALQMFMKLWYQCDIRVAHNTTFDNRIIRISLKRYMRDLIKDEVWKDRDLYYCTLQNSRKIMGGKSGHTLAEAYLHFTGKVLENAHSAMADTQACMDIYFSINNKQENKIEKRTDFGWAEGACCGRNGCDGLIGLSPVENCSCHISPPCSQCTSRTLSCPICEWDEDDEPIQVQETKINGES